MIKKISGAVLLVLLFTGCGASVQTSIDSYKESRAKFIKNVDFIKAEKACIAQCNQTFDFGIKRADCKFGCVK